MKISALRLFNVKRFAGRGVAIEGIGDGVNVLCAANEFGKSTSFEALHALFFQPYSGKSGPVRNLRPYSGGNPLVEADIAHGEERFRITKQYYGGGFARVTDLASGRLVAQADEAENFISALIKGGPAGPAGLLWVRQGVTGIEKRSNAEEDGEKQVRASLLESVQGEVEAMTGGRRMAEIMQTVAGELDKLVTKRGPKAGGRYAAAIEARDRLAAEEARLSADVGLLREALDKRATALKRLAELDGADERQQRQDAVASAQVAFEAAQAQGERLKTAEAELKLARERRDGAGRALEAFRTALQKDADLAARRREAERRRGEAVGRRGEAAEASARAQAAADLADAQELETRELLARLDAALRAREAAERLAESRQRLSEAEAKRAALEEAEAQLALVGIQPGAIEELQALEIELSGLRAVAEAARPSVAVAYSVEAGGEIVMDGVPLADGQERSYDGQAQLVVMGIGVISLRSNKTPSGDRRLEQAEERRRALLDAMGVETLAAARARQVRAQQIDAEMRELRGSLSSLAPAGLARLREEVAAQALAGAELSEPEGDAAQLRAALSAAERQRLDARQALREAEPDRRRAEDAIVAAETALATLRTEQAHVEAQLGAEEQRAARERALCEDFADRSREAENADARAAELRAAAIDLVSAEAALKRARSVQSSVEQQIVALREAVAGLNAGIRARSDEAVEESWRETAEALSAAELRVAAFDKEIAVLQRLAVSLDRARSEARELYLKPVMAELSPLLGLLFDDASVTFDERTLLPQTISRNGQEEEVERLSGGMREQLSVLTRLAFARLLARGGRPAPVILDDALVYSDDDRIERMFDALHRQSRDQQIIVFSCRQRAFQKLGGNTLAMVDWRP
ncbi:DNA-binding protein [Bosea sp. (in: a-proteobacteria)]|uniref:AAA family ATPase n=1 Tax=Bosea sp. (in: a-proteobacteria) TaxID=1871050 RepID=UPI00121F9F9E|nr:DNA-binding protein [Bosea sp. (in: a-proteobacteria)]TAJ26979.1 MAG: DNA-binding protein [Bosea sp. (in: a-proteobacteria)]